ncbi:MAG: hypothetical protein HY349_08140 [Nitrospirae bacterium]|nr:hypothetical protein [Nitrospirota bacterium]
MKLQRISLQENADLQKLILAQLQELAGGIELLEPGLSSEAGPLCLGMDEERRWVVLISSIEENDAMLVRALGQMNWVVRHQSLLVRLFPKRGVGTSRPPRAVLIAPSFSSVLQEAVAFMGQDIDLYQYRALEIDRQKTLLFDPASVFRPRPPASVVSVSVIPRDSSPRLQLSDAERSFFEGSPHKGLPI